VAGSTVRRENFEKERKIMDYLQSAKYAIDRGETTSHSDWATPLFLKSIACALIAIAERLQEKQPSPCMQCDAPTEDGQCLCPAHLEEEYDWLHHREDGDII